MVGLPNGPSSGATAAANIGTISGDAAVTEAEGEEGAVLLKNNNNTLPISQSDLSGGVAVTGPGAEYQIAAPARETGEGVFGQAISPSNPTGTTGIFSRVEVSPLQQLANFSNDPGAFSYTAAQSPTGETVPTSALSDSNASQTGVLDCTGVASPEGATGSCPSSTASSLDFTTASNANGQVGNSNGPITTPGQYQWQGYMYVPSTDAYTLRFQGLPLVGANSSAHANTTTTWAGGLETITYTANPGSGGSLADVPPPAGQPITIANACPSSLNGNYYVSKSSQQPITNTTFRESVSFPVASNPGSCATSLAPTTASFSAGAGTVTLGGIPTTIAPSVGSQVVVSGVTPAIDDGDFNVTASTTTSVTYAVNSTAPQTPTLSSPSVGVTSTGTTVVDANVSLQFGTAGGSLPGTSRTLSAASSFYIGQYGGSAQYSVPVNPTDSGYTQGGLYNVAFNAGTLTNSGAGSFGSPQANPANYYPITINYNAGLEIRPARIVARLASASATAGQMAM